MSVAIALYDAILLVTCEGFTLLVLLSAHRFKPRSHLKSKVSN